MEKLKDFFKRPQVWGFFVSVAALAIIAIAFFYPDNFEGNSLRQPDMQQGAANGHEGAAFEAQTGEKALWTNALMSGMPTFQISPSYPSNDLFTWLNSVYGLGLPAPSNLLFMMMFGFLILLFAMRMRWYLALIGAVAWGFSSYFVIIIGAGHIWKFLALTYVPPTIAGLILLYRGRYIVGTAMLALFAMLQLNANHPQMTYYFGLVMIILVIAWFVDAIRKKHLKSWVVSSALTLAAGALAIGANAPSLYNTYEYSKETKRSQSELTPADDGSARAANAERPTGGMAKSEIVGWSYGRSEMFSLIVPNIKGGASARPEGGQMVPMSLDKLEGGEALAQNAPLLQYMSQYFNDSEGTNGPVYVGALIFALFLVGCCIVKGPEKWALIVATLLSVILALGRNAEGITDFMIYNFPLYNKFRAVESILVIAEFTIPLLAILALGQIFDKGREAWKEYRRPLLIGFGIPVFVCVLALVAPTVFGPTITETDRALAENVQQQLVDYGRSYGMSDEQISGALYSYSLSNAANLDAINSLRAGMVRADGLRSLFVILLGFGFLYLFMAGKLKLGMAVAGVGVVILGDLYGVDKRYVSHSSFTADGSASGEIVFHPDNIDNLILTDTVTHYRVLDIPGFNSADRSYFHKTLGGYHAAKLNRYEDIIRRKLAPVISNGYYRGDPLLEEEEYADVARILNTGYTVADMLNARYIITGDPSLPLVKNSNALGNAWFIDSILWVDNADSEMAALDVNTLDLRHQAVADSRFADVLPETPTLAPGDTIYLTSYTPNTLTYHAATTDGGVGVFSEVYFPWGWKADIDGKPTSIARVNYILRAMAIPAGRHTITMRFDPDSIHTCSTIAYTCIILVYMLILAAIFVEVRRNRLLKA